MRLPDPARSRVVLIGASTYADAENLPELPAVRRSVADLREALTDPEFGIVPPENCTVLLDHEAVPALARELLPVVEAAEDLLLVYFAGHGLKAGRRHTLYLGQFHTSFQAPQFGSLAFDTLRDAVLDSPATTKVIVLDCCLAGLALGEPMGEPGGALMSEVEVEGAYVMVSAPRNKAALILPGEERTAFTERLLRVLRSGVPGGPELLSVEGVYKRLRSVMSGEGLNLPDRRSSRTADEIALVRNRGLAATALPLLRARRQAATEKGAAGDWVTAAAELHSLVAECLRVLGPGHPETFLARQYSAHATGAAGDPGEAVTLLRALLTEQTRVWGPDHEDTLRTRQFLAVNLGEGGSRADALTVLRVLLPDRRRVLGPDHPETLRTGHVLARTLAHLDHLDEAVAVLRETVAGRERVLGPDDEETGRTRLDLAALTRHRPRTAGATDV
jgi:uncharacterized caspase-like protein